jgi:hypothetical protein
LDAESDEHKSHKDKSIEVVTVETTDYTRLEQLIHSKSHQHILFKEKIFNAFPLDISFRQGKNNKLCIATTGNQSRCSKIASTGNPQLRDEMCQQISKLKQYEAEYNLLTQVLRRIEDPILCKKHHEYVKNHLQPFADQFISTYGSEDSCSLLLELRQAFQYWASEIISPGISPRREHNQKSIKSRPLNSSIQRQFLEEEIDRIVKLIKSPHRVATTELIDRFLNVHQGLYKRFNIGNFIRTKFYNRNQKSKPSERYMKELITRQLSSDEAQKSGYVYIFTFEMAGFSGRYKIGVSHDPDSRVNKLWTTHYQQRPRMVFNELEMQSSISDDIRPIPHYKRLEELIFGELREHRYTQLCSSGCKHVEWVQATEDHVIAVVQKWCKWMRQRPYEFGRPWRLKENIRNDKDAMDALCNPVLMSKESG